MEVEQVEVILQEEVVEVDPLVKVEMVEMVAALLAMVETVV